MSLETIPQSSQLPPHILSRRDELLRRAVKPVPSEGSKEKLEALAVASEHSEDPDAEPSPEPQSPESEETLPAVSAPSPVTILPPTRPLPALPPIVRKQVLVVHPVADITLEVLDVLETPTLVFLLLPLDVKSKFAPKFETKFELEFDGKRAPVMAITEAAHSKVFPCSFICFLKYNPNDQDSEN